MDLFIRRQWLGAAVRELIAEPAARYALIQRVLGVVSGPLTAFMIVRFLSSIDQGYYFSFLSLSSIAMFFELGFGNIVVQWIAHSWSGSDYEAADRVDRVSRSEEGRIVIGIAKRWYRVAGVMFACVAVPAGLWWFTSEKGSTESWHLAWSLYAVGIACNLSIAWIVSASEGLGEISLVYRLRLYSSVLGIAGLLISIACGGGYFSLAVQQFIQLGVTAVLINPMRRRIATVPKAERGALSAFWWDKILPLQWRSAIVVVSSFFLFQATTLVAFRVIGAADAGRLGFASAIGGVLSSLVLLVLSVNAVKLGGLAASRDWPEFEARFRRYLIIGLIVGVIAALGADALLIVATCLHWIKPERIVSQLVLWCIFLSALISACVQGIVMRIRCIKREPFAWENLVAALVWPGLAFVMGAHFGINGLAVGYLALIIMGLWFPIYLKLRRNEARWRQAL